MKDLLINQLKSDYYQLFGNKKKGNENIEFDVFCRNNIPYWLIESSWNRPYFTKIWPRISLKSKIFYYLYWKASSFGLNFKSKDKVIISIAKDSFYKQIKKEYPNIAIFLGRSGYTQKFVLYLNNDQTSFFAKFPIGINSKSILKSEIELIKFFSKVKEVRDFIPNNFSSNGILFLEELKNNKFKNKNLRFNDVYKIVKKFSENSKLIISKEDFINEINNSLLTLSNSIEKERKSKLDLKDICLKCRQFAINYLDKIDNSKIIITTFAHGDLAPWNVFTSQKGDTKLIDWELAGRRPIYFDLIHYYFSYYLLVKKFKYIKIIKKLIALKPSDIKSSDWLFSISLYLVYQSIYYSYLHQTHFTIFPQYTWQLEGLMKSLNFISSKIFL